MTTAGGPIGRCRRCGTFLPPAPADGRGPDAPARVGCPRCGLRPDGHRWVAHPPGAPAVPGQTGPPTEPLPRIPAGPAVVVPRPVPRAPAGHPRWGLPTVAWPASGGGPGPRPAANPRPLLGGAAGLLFLVAALALFSAGAETWRFLLLLRGRTAVLPAGQVGASDMLVAVTGLVTPAGTVAALAVCVPALLRTVQWAARRAGVRPPRTTAAVLLRLLVPGWNVYGAGQVVLETHALLLAPPATPDPVDPLDRSERVGRRDRRLLLLWWSAWVVNIGLVVAAIARGRGGSLQAIADTVELHIAVDLAAAVTALLGALVLLRWRRLANVAPTVSSRWVVQPPPPTRGGPAGPRPPHRPAGPLPRDRVPSPGGPGPAGSPMPRGDSGEDRDVAGRSVTVSA